MSGARVIRLMLLGLITVGLIGTAGWFIFGPKSSSQYLLMGQASYDAGVRALQEKNGPAAKQRFQEAQLTAQNAIARVGVERTARNINTEQAQELAGIEGKAFFLKAMALRDEAYASALEDNKEIPDTLDTSTGQNYRTIMVISDRDAKSEAIALLRNAAARLPQDADILNEAIRTEVSMEPIAWGPVHHFSTDLLKLKPNDARALYLLARYDFEQPQIGIGQVHGPATPLAKRQRSLVLAALDRIAKLKTVEKYQPGRTLFLEAQVQHWLINHYANQKDDINSLKHRDALDTLLFDPKSGALARFKSGEGMKEMPSTFDIDGIVGIHLLALDVAAERQRKQGESLSHVKSTLRDTVAILQEFDKMNLPYYTLDNMNSALALALSKTQSVLAAEGSQEWNDTLDLARKSFKKSLEKDLLSAPVAAEFTSLLQREAVVANKAGEENRAKALRAEAQSWVDDSLANFDKRKLPIEASLVLHQLAAELKFAANAKREQIEPHLKLLRESKNSDIHGIAHLIQGVVYEREGRLEKAKQELELALTSKHPDVKLRANMALCNVYLALGAAEQALESLQTVDRVYDGFEELSPQEKIWAQHFLRSPDDMAVLLIAANLESAKQRIIRFQRDQPGKNIPASLFAIYEKNAISALSKLPKQKKHALLARQTLINYYLSLGRFEEADKELAAASKEHPNSAALMQQRIAMMVRQAREKAGEKLDKTAEKELNDKVDATVQQFIQKFPEDRAARLIWVNWLARSNREDQALDYLQSPTNFPGVKDKTYHRLLASILVAKGDKGQASKVLQQLPQDPLIDAMLIQVADTSKDRQGAVQEAMSRYVSNGLFRIWNAELALQENRYADAANHFFNTLDFTQVKPLAQRGLERSLIALADEKPAEARKLITEMLKDHPNEPVLLLPYAAACLKLDDIGTLEDNWATVKTMASALQAWEQSMQKTANNRAVTTLIKAQLWTRSNDFETARLEVLRALEISPGEPNALALMIQMDLALVRIPEARKYLDQLKKIKPDDPTTTLLEARIESADGHHTKAINLLEPLLEKHPKESGAYRFLIHLLTRDKQSAKAVQWSERWVEKLPDDLDGAQMLVAQLSLSKKNSLAKTKADEFLKKALKEVRKQLDERKYEGEKDPKAKREEYYTADRQTLELHFARAFMMGEDEAEAERRVKAIVKENPDFIAAQMLLGDMHFKRNAWREMEKSFSKVLELDKGNFVAGNNLAWVLAVKLNEPEKALELLRTISKGRYSGKTLPGDRLHVEVLDTLGVVYLKLNRKELYPEMVQVFEAARKRYPRDPRMYLYQGHGFAGLADHKKAMQSFDSAIALASSSESSISEAQRESVIRDAQAAKNQLPKK
jgi:tetratricopeptide (TPR) repeat protein